MWTDTTRALHARAGLALPTDFTDAEWAVLEPLLSLASHVGRPRKWPLRRIVEAILYPHRGGLPWRIPPCIGGFVGKAIDRVARNADAYIGSSEVCDFYVEKLRQQGKDSNQAKVRITGIFMVVAYDPEHAIEELASHFHYINNSYGELALKDKAIGAEKVMTR